jgi:NADP-dependent 3-hydroxy acid dehydrogenase YdfG
MTAKVVLILGASSGIGAANARHSLPDCGTIELETNAAFNQALTAN